MARGATRSRPTTRPTSRFGSPDDFRWFVDQLHQRGIGVIVDWVPAHFPKDEWALARFDGTPLYEHPDPRRGEQPDWGTYVFDFGRHEVRNFLVANALYWFEEFHLDGLRVDAVASMLYLDYSRNEGEWVPNVHGGRENLEAVQLLQELNATVYKHHPDVMMIAEESTAWPGVSRPTDGGGLGFGFKWNMGWMHDTLSYLGHEPIHRSYHHGEMTFSIDYAFSENFVLPLSHDEVVHGKGSLWGRMPGDAWNKAAGVRGLLGVHVGTPGQADAVHGRRVRPGVRVGRVAVAGLGPARRAAAQRHPAPRHRPQRASTARHRRCGPSTPARRASAGSTPATPPATSSRSCASARTAPRSRASRTSPGSRTTTTAWACPRRARGARSLNTDAEVYGGSGVGNLGAVRPRTSRCTACRVGGPAAPALRSPLAHAVSVQPPSAAETTSRASAWTWARCSGPWNDSA